MRRQPLRKLGLYRTGSVSPQLRRQLTVGRDTVLRDTLDHLRSGLDRKSKHHFLFLGPRGIGKTHLLKLIEDGIAEDPRLVNRIVVARFPEESLGTLSFADFLVRLVRVVADSLPAEQSWDAIHKIVSANPDVEEVIDTVVPAIRKANNKNGRTILVLLENLNEMFSKQIRKEKDIGALRKFFMDKNGCQLVATAPTYFDAVTDVAQPFYDFFDTQVLEVLTKEHAVTLMQRHIDAFERGDELDCVELAPMLMSLHDMVEGNPRSISMACALILEQEKPTVRNAIESLIDQNTPVYQSLLSATAPQERALLEKLASMRDPSTPRTPRNIASQLGISQRQVSSLLNRLTDDRILKNEVDPNDRRIRVYSIRDGFLDIWLACSLSQRLREHILLIGDCLESFYRRPDGPFDRSGHPRDFSLIEWPPSKQLFAENQGGSNYLAALNNALRKWRDVRAGDFESMATMLAKLGGVSQKNVSRVLLMLDSATEDKSADNWLRKAYLHFLLDEPEHSEKCLRCAIEVAGTDDSLLSVGLKNLVFLLKTEMRHSEAEEFIGRYPGITGLEFTGPGTSGVALAPDTGASVYVSYAWGDDSPEGKQREQIVDLLCTTLRIQGIHVQRDKDQLTAGKSIAEFAKQLSKSARIIAVISDRSLHSRYCMVDELFQAYQRRAFDNTEFQEAVIPLILDDARGLIQSPKQVAELAAYWKSEANTLRKDLEKFDPNAKTSREIVNQIDEMSQRLPDMLGALNDVVMKRGFDEIVRDNFAEVVSRIPLADSSVPTPSLQTDSSTLENLASRVGSEITSQLESACLKMNSHEVADLFTQGVTWLDSGGRLATASVRKQLLLWLANAILHDQDENRIQTHSLMDVQKFLDRADAEPADSDIASEALRVAIRTHFQELTGEEPTSLEALKRIDHPIALGNRIRILINRKKIDEAFSLVHHNPLHDRWAELAVVVYARADRLSDAEAICERMRSRGTTDNSGLTSIRYYRCLLVLADEIYVRTFARRKEGESLYADRLTLDEKKGVSHVLRILEPIISKVLGAGRVESGVERQALELAIGTAHLHGNSDQSSRRDLPTNAVPHEVAVRISAVLAASRPVSKRIVQSVRGGYLKPTRELLENLKADWPDDKEVALSIIETQSLALQDYEGAVDSMVSLSSSDFTPEQRDRLACAALQISANSETGTRDMAFGCLAKLVGAKHHYLKIVEAKWALDENDARRSLNLLNERPAPEDSDWLSLRAYAYEQLGELKKSVSDLQQLCRLTSAPRALRRTAELADRIGERDLTIELLERLCHFPPERTFAQRKLAEVLYRGGSDQEIERAGEIFQKLYNESPDEPEIAFNAVTCFAERKDFSKAFTLLEEVTNEHPDVLLGFTMFAGLLSVNKRVDEAFSLLNDEAVRTRFWNETQFLVAYMDLGYRTDHELEAHRAMLQIRNLENGKDEPDRTIRKFEFEEAVDFLRGRREYLDEMDSLVVGGRIPWTLLPLKEGTPLQQVWSYRTQNLVPWETKSGRAHFSIYASNGYCAVNEGDERRQLVRLSAAKEGSDIVVDISALITLHNLGLIDATTKYFGKIFVPSLYRNLELEDARRLQPHQRSRIDQSRRLFELRSTGQLRRPDASTVDRFIVDLEAQADAKQCTVGDFVDWFFRQGAISKQVRDRSFKLSGIESSNSNLLNGVNSLDSFQFSIFAIRTLESAGMIDNLLRSSNIFITAEAASEIEQEQFSINLQSRIERESTKLWQSIRDNDSFAFSRVNESYDDSRDSDGVESEDETDRIGFDLCLCSLELAKQKRLPLLADDRVLHSLMHSGGQVFPASSSAFSTLELLNSLKSANQIDDDEFLQHVLRLIACRYRFVLLEESALLHAAKAFHSSANAVPNPLNRIAEYVQDTMVDIGLFGGDEAVEPPRSIALEQFAHWTRVCARFVNGLWSDSEFTDRDAEFLSRWAIDNLLPQVALTIRPDIQIKLAQDQAKLFVSHLLSERGLKPDISRSAQLMSMLRECLGMHEGEFSRAVFGLIQVDDDNEGLDLSASEWKRVKEVHRRGIAKHALSQFQDDGGYKVDARGSALLEASRSLKKRVDCDPPPDSILDVMRDFGHARFVKETPPGPLFFYQEEDRKSIGVFQSTDLLVYPHSDARSAALAFFMTLESRSHNVVSKRTKEVLRKAKAKVAQKRAINWYPAAEDLLEVIESDWQLNAAGFRQSLRTKKQDWIQSYWLRCVRPSIHPAGSVPTSAFHACTDAKTMKERVFNELGADLDPQALIDMYCECVGHLPLDGEWSLSTLLERNDDEERWKQVVDLLLELASREDSLHAYQGCRALIDSWEKLNDEQCVMAGERISRFITMSRSIELDTPQGRFWFCLHRLANHFLDWIPLYGPELGEDNSASLAWWLSERLTTILMDDIEAHDNPKERFEFIRDRTIDSLCEFSFSANQLIWGGRSSTVFHMNTHLIQNGGPFFTSLITSMGERFAEISKWLDDAAKEQITHWMFVNAIHLPTGVSQPNSLLFREHGERVECVLDKWKHEIGAEEKVLEQFAKFREESTRASEEYAVEQLLKEFDSMDEMDRGNWLHRLLIAARHQVLASMPFLRMLRSQSERTKFVGSLTVDHLSLVIELLLVIHQQAGDPWHHELPQQLVYWLDDVDSDEKKALVLNAILCSSVAGNSPSALRRVRESVHASDMEEVFRFQSERIQSYRNAVPRWTWSRLRTYANLLT